MAERGLSEAATVLCSSEYAVLVVAALLVPVVAVTLRPAASG